MPPITWQNIRYTNPAEATAPMAAATQTLNNAFAPLTQAVNKLDATNDANWQAQKTNFQNDSMSKLMAYTDADKYAQAVKDGTIASIIGEHGGDVDQAALRTFADARTGVLQQRAEQAINYNHAMTDEKTAPLVDAAHAAAMRGDTAGYNAAQSAYTAAGGRDLTGLLQYKDQRDRQMVERGYADTNQTENIKNIDSQIATRADQAKASLMSAGAAASQARTAQGELVLNGNRFSADQTDKMFDRQAKARAEVGQAYAMSNPMSVEGQQMITESLKSIPDPGDRTSRMQAIQDIIKNHPGITTGTAISLAQGMNAGHWYIPGMIQRGLAYMDAGDAEKSAANTQSALVAGHQQQAAMKNLQTITDRLNNGISTNWGQPAGPGGFSGSGVLPGTASGIPGKPERPMAPSSTNTLPGTLPQSAAISAEMDRDPVVQRINAAAHAAQQGGSIGPNGWVPNGASPAAGGTGAGAMPTPPAVITPGSRLPQDSPPIFPASSMDKIAAATAAKDALAKAKDTSDTQAAKVDALTQRIGQLDIMAKVSPTGGNPALRAALVKQLADLKGK